MIISPAMAPSEPPPSAAGLSPSPPRSIADVAAAGVATWFGAGLLPWAPGTWGSLAALPFAWGLCVMSDGPLPLALATAGVALLGWISADHHARRIGEADPGQVVVDEVAGQWLTLVAVPPDILAYAAGFLLFRLFDIWKPWPAGWADRTLKGGLGIMVDDIVAGAYAGLVLHGLLLWRGS
ncbi:MAG: phosphatidylglycerophosphatase A [Alphaproteobacteria bacterium]